MSTYENKVIATRDFLENRASLNRLTNYQELCRFVGELLFLREQRSVPMPVDRDKMTEVLKAIDDVTVAEKGFMLSSIVVHFFDNEAGHRFFDQAYERGIYESDTDPDYRRGLHADQVAKAFAAYPDFIPVVLPEREEEVITFDEAIAQLFEQQK